MKEFQCKQSTFLRRCNTKWKETNLQAVCYSYSEMLTVISNSQVNHFPVNDILYSRSADTIYLSLDGS